MHDPKLQARSKSRHRRNGLPRRYRPHHSASTNSIKQTAIPQSPETSRRPSAGRFSGESLFRNSASLVINLIISAGCGYGALDFLTRIYSVRAVGLSATAASVSTLIVTLTQFGVTSSLPRFLPTSKNRAALINSVLTLILSSTLLATIAFLLLPYARKFFALGAYWFVIAFLVVTCAQAGQSALSTVLIADRRSSKLARANIFPNLIGLAAPGALLFSGSLGAYISRFASNIASFAVLGTMVAKGGHRFRLSLNRAALSDLGRFSLGIYLASLLGSLPNMLLPIIILSRFGPRQSAYWSIAMTIAILFFQLSGAVSQALLPEVAHRPRERRQLLLRAAFLIVALMAPILAIAYFVAPLPLRLLGAGYSAGALAPLRWLIIAGYVTILNYVFGTVLVLAKKTFLMSLVNVVNAVIVLGMALAWATNANGVAIGWVVGDIANTSLFGFFAFLTIYEVRGRWEILGSPSYLASILQITQRSGSNSQYQALEVLRIVSELQGSARKSGSRTKYPEKGLDKIP
jgi:O-antigen/teichoic acid export membrane protein